jgi:ribonuclease P protein component
VVVDLVDSLPEGTDVVVRALPPAADASFDGLASDYRSALATATRRATERAQRS